MASTTTKQTTITWVVFRAGTVTPARVAERLVVEAEVVVNGTLEVVVNVLAETQRLRDSFINIRTNHSYLGCLPSRDRSTSVCC